MDPKSLRNLKFDRRLHTRRGWVTRSELETEIETLPDAAEKAETIESGADPRTQEASESAS